MSNETSATEMTDSADVQNDEELDFGVDAEVEPETEETGTGAESTEETEAAKEEVEGEYTLDLSELAAEDMPYVEILTKHAKGAGIEAKKASEFIVGFTKSLHSFHAEQEEQQKQDLRKEWGKSFKEKYTQTRNYMSRLFSKAKLTDEERAMFSNVAGYRVCHKFMAAMGEKGTYAGGRAKVQDSRSTQERIDAEVIKLCEMRANPNPNMPEIEAQKAKINKIAGMILY
jgi:hypothetical protein